MPPIGAFTTFIDEDVAWIPQYFAEIERLAMPFAIYLDRCSPETKQRFTSHPLCVGSYEQNDPALEYTEQHKQKAFDILVKQGFRWALSWDIDERWDRDAAEKLKRATQTHHDYLRVQWVNCWDDENHIRVDTLFAAARRVKLYNLTQGRRWRHDHPITMGCKLVDSSGVPLLGPGDQGETDIVCLHYGLMTRELREFHKARWDRIYTTAVGNNPYGGWNYALDEVNYPATVVPNPHR